MQVFSMPHQHLKAVSLEWSQERQVEPTLQGQGQGWGVSEFRVQLRDQPAVVFFIVFPNKLSEET